jgi:hypothetical protein
MTVPSTVETSTFHGSTAALLAEMTFDIMRHVSVDSLFLPMDGGVGMRRYRNLRLDNNRTSANIPCG